MRGMSLRSLKPAGFEPRWTVAPFSLRCRTDRVCAWLVVWHCIPQVRGTLRTHLHLNPPHSCVRAPGVTYHPDRTIALIYRPHSGSRHEAEKAIDGHLNGSLWEYCWKPRPRSQLVLTRSNIKGLDQVNIHNNKCKDQLFEMNLPIMLKTNGLVL